MTKSKQKPPASEKITRKAEKPVATGNTRPEFGKPTWTKDIILAVVNIVLIIGLFFLLGQLPSKANEISKLRSLGLEGTADIQKFELENYTGDIEKLDSAFVGEEGLLGFVGEIEKLKEDGTVVDFSFQNEDPVMDKTKNLGLPISIIMSGSWEEIAADLVAIQSLPYLFRPIAFEAEELQAGGVEVQYGGILYVNENFE